MHEKMRNLNLRVFPFFMFAVNYLILLWMKKDTK